MLSFPCEFSLQPDWEQQIIIKFDSYLLCVFPTSEFQHSCRCFRVTCLSYFFLHFQKLMIQMNSGCKEEEIEVDDKMEADVSDEEMARRQVIFYVIINIS